MATIYKCPVCGKQYTDLTKLADCVKADDAAMKKVKNDEKNRYHKLLAAARADVRRAEDTLRQCVNAYNVLVNEAAKKVGDTYTPLEFKGVAAVAPTASDKYAFAKEAAKEADNRALDKAATDLANIIFQTLGI